MVHETAVIDEGAIIGEGTKIWHFCHVSATAVIGKNCILGQNVFVGEDVHIGNNVKIQNNVSVYSGVTIEDCAFIGPSVVFTNVRIPDATYKQPYVQTLVCKGAMIGANATIVCGNIIGDQAVVGAGSVVTHNVASFTTVWGVPARCFNDDQ